MQIVINDFGGYAFIGQLARELANRGNEVKHLFCASLTTTPRGCDENTNFPDRYSPIAISLAAPLDKYSLVKRRRQEIEYGRAAARLLAEHASDVVFSANTPLDAQTRIWAAAARRGAKRVFWLQDIIGLATKKLLAKRLPILGSIVGQLYINLETRLLRQSDHVIAISSAFNDYLDLAAVNGSKRSVIENWAPLDQIPVKPRRSPWSEKHGLNDAEVLTYSGTLSLKHNPKMLWELALSLENRGAIVVVRSQGAGAEWLREQMRIRPLKSLRVLDYAPLEELPDVLAASDILVALLEKDAGEFSVPSKVLSYMCAGRALLAAMPLQNLAARTVIECGAGRVVPPGETQEFTAAANRLISDNTLRFRMGESARKFAEKRFDISRIASIFESLASSICDGRNLKR